MYDETGRNVAVLVTDTAGRAWRTGQTDLAVGVAGLEPLDDFAGSTDSYGNELAVTAPAVADELASLAELVTGKLGGRPVSVVRGLVERVLPAGEHGPGAVVLLRPREQDMFALGAREAVLAAVRGDQADCFGAPGSAEEVRAALRVLRPGRPRSKGSPCACTCRPTHVTRSPPPNASGWSPTRTAGVRRATPPRTTRSP